MRYASGHVRHYRKSAVACFVASGQEAVSFIASRSAAADSLPAAISLPSPRQDRP
jgi:hypothetical protein